MLLNLRSNKVFLEKEQNALLGWISKIENKYRFSKAAILLLLGESIILKPISPLEMKSLMDKFEANPPPIVETAAGIFYGLGDYDSVQEIIELVGRADWIGRIALRALYYIGERIEAYPRIGLSIGKRLDDGNSVEHSLLALMMVGFKIQKSISTIDRIVRKLSENNERIAACAAETLALICDSRFLSPLTEAKRTQKYGWVRNIFDRAITTIETCIELKQH